jgi:hypothetical protein
MKTLCPAFRMQAIGEGFLRLGRLADLGTIHWIDEADSLVELGGARQRPAH